MTALKPSGTLSIGGAQLEYRLIGPAPDQAPTIVMLHEGLGCVGLWGDFPDKLAEATGAGVFVYSRAGYGQSSPKPPPWPLNFMEIEALDVLPKVLDAIGFRRGLLLGHSDGASIATLYAGGVQDHRVRGVILIAPHFIVEEFGQVSIRKTDADFRSGGKLRERLARWHRDVDGAFIGWSDVWRSEKFRDWNISESLAYIRVPLQIVQGADDQYGTLRHIEIAQEECYCPVDVAVISGAAHSPHREAPDITLKTTADFVNRLLSGHGEGRAGQAA